MCVFFSSNLSLVSPAAPWLPELDTVTSLQAKSLNFIKTEDVEPRGCTAQHSSMNQNDEPIAHRFNCPVLVASTDCCPLYSHFKESLMMMRCLLDC